MTTMVQTDLGPPSASKYKDNATDDPLRHVNAGNHSQQHHSLQQHPRPAALVQQQKQQPNSPHQSNTSIPAGTYTAPHALTGVSIPQHPQYGPPTQDPGYYASHPNPYPATSTAGQYSSSGPPDLMAATAQMQRPYPPIYHTPQSNSPASVASPQTHDQHGRNIYAQSPQMASQMFGYQPYSSMNPVHPSPYTPHPPTPQLPLTTQPLLMPPQTNAAPIQHQHQQTHATAMTGSPRTKMEPISQQRTQVQRAVLTPHTATTAPPMSSSNTQTTQPSGTSPNAAPGPIPATTPLVVRQDSNGVQWIAFEYSRDRVKMEYTIRCDVESVNVDDLSQEFKTENCVYPRACCSKEQYRGNRLVYETECNAVGWALAQLNPPLRGKRGLIQRAVDSWRNSNADPRLRSRRVRRMAKMNRRQAMQGSQPNHLVGTTAPMHHGLSGTTAGLPAPSVRPGGPLPLAGPPLHHHHAHPNGSAGNEEVSGGTDYSNGAHRPSILATGPPPTMHGTPDLRTGQVFHGLPAYPPAASASGAPGGPSLPPSLHGSGFDTLGRHSTVATSSRRDGQDTFEEDANTRHPDNVTLFGGLPEGKRRKFILVDDPQRGTRVRVKVMLDQVDMNEIPDSYRLSNAVYPRAYFPVQMKSPPGRVVPGKRYFDDESDGEDDGAATIGRTLVPAPSIDGEAETAVPKLSRSRHQKEMILNDLGYRMSWSQSRVFAGRTLFLQRSLDAYRNKMRSTMLTTGQEPTSIAPHFETRQGKRKWLERGRRNNAASGTGSDSGTAAVTVSASQRSAEEVEG
ncbi:hypothetical protein VTN77DRAFT_2834 [Rasamsonia byssochlamydoides]|uniref:uncharacterized protein n=1 Tax=Rasamsonia byssochlamydoides TaxID=89139 RepID=UPI0037422D83